MKKILSMVVLTILSITSMSNISISKNYNFKVNQITNIINNKNLKLDPIINWKKIDKKGIFANKINNNLFVLVGHFDKDYLVDKNGKIIKELKMENKNVCGGGFRRLNDSKVIFSGNSYFTSSYMMDSNGNFNNLGKRGIFFHFNNQIGVFREIGTNKSYFLNSFGQFIEIKKDNMSIIALFLRFSDNLSVMTGGLGSWLMDSNGNFIKKLDKNIESLVTLNDRKAIVNVSINSGYEAWLMDSNGVFIKNLGKTKYQGFTRLNDNLGVFIDGLNNSWIINSNGDLIKKLTKNGSFTRLNDNLGVFIDDLNETWLMDLNGNFIKKLNKKGSTFTFTRLNDNLGVFIDDSSVSYILSITPSSNDIAGLKASVHFDAKKEGQIITDINTSKYQGKGSNGDVNFHIENENITEVKIDGYIQSITDHRVQKIISDNGSHKIVITNLLTFPLEYNLYIKKEPLKDNIIPTSTSTSYSNYVGIIINKNLSNTKIPNLIDVLQYEAEIKLDYNDFLLDSNKYYMIDREFKFKNPIDIFKYTKISLSGNYLVQASDLIHNVWQQYLTIGKPTITDFRSTDQWKQLDTWALKNGYKQDYLNKINASQIKDLLSIYNSNPDPSPAPNIINSDNGLGWIWVPTILGTIITFGGFWLIIKFQIIPRIKLKKLIKKHNKEIKEFETRKTEKENKND